MKGRDPTYLVKAASGNMRMGQIAGKKGPQGVGSEGLAALDGKRQGSKAGLLSKKNRG